MKKLPKTLGKMVDGAVFGEIVYKPSIFKAFAVIENDEHGQIIYTFDDKKKADQFYKALSKRV